MMTGTRLHTGFLKGKVTPVLSAGTDLPQEEADWVHKELSHRPRS